MVYNGIALAAPILYSMVAAGRFHEPKFSDTSLFATGITFFALCGAGFWIASSALLHIWAQCTAACIYYVAALCRAFNIDGVFALSSAVAAAVVWLLSTWLDAYSSEQQRWIQFTAALFYTIVEISRCIRTGDAAQTWPCGLAFVGSILWLISVALR